jgi:hypothetical protein
MKLFNVKIVLILRDPESLKVNPLAAGICPHRRKSADRRPAIQAPPAIHQRREQMNNTKLKKNEMWLEFYSTEVVINREWAKPNYDLDIWLRIWPCMTSTTRFVKRKVTIFQLRVYSLSSLNKNCRTANARYVIQNVGDTTSKIPRARRNHCPLTQKKTNAHCAKFNTLLECKKHIKIFNDNAKHVELCS